MQPFELLDGIYEAPIVPELWPKVLEDVANRTASAGGLLFAANRDYAGWTSSQALFQILQLC